MLAESAAALRRREMGIRAASGARGSQLRKLLLSDTFRLVGAGLVLGFALSWLGAGTIRTFLFQVEPFDPLVTLGAAAIIVVVATLVSLRPAPFRVSISRAFSEMTERRCARAAGPSNQMPMPFIVVDGDGVPKSCVAVSTRR